jgi:hypothetical protein
VLWLGVAETQKPFSVFGIQTLSNFHRKHEKTWQADQVSLFSVSYGRMWKKGWYKQEMTMAVL